MGGDEGDGSASAAQVPRGNEPGDAPLPARCREGFGVVDCWVGEWLLIYLFNCFKPIFYLFYILFYVFYIFYVY